MNKKAEKPLQEAIVLIQEVLVRVPDDETAWYLGEALKRLEEAISGEQ